VFEQQRRAIAELLAAGGSGGDDAGVPPEDAGPSEAGGPPADGGASQAEASGAADDGCGCRCGPRRVPATLALLLPTALLRRRHPRQRVTGDAQ